MTREINEFVRQFNDFKTKWSGKARVLSFDETQEYHDDKRSLDEKLNEIQDRAPKIESEEHRNYFKLEVHKCRQEYVEAELNFSVQFQFQFHLSKLATNTTETSNSSNRQKRNFKRSKRRSTKRQKNSMR